MHPVAILGSGFGLYGYLPALAAGGATPILLPARYRERFTQRPELARFADAIVWTRDEDDALRTATGVVLALAPEMQCNRLAECLHYDNLQYLLLEKPLAPNPKSAAGWHARLVESGKAFRVAYVFRFLDWSDELRAFCAAAGGAGLITIRWHFLAHHVRFAVDTWKRQNRLGGGAIRFYGIHLIALLAELGYAAVSSSQSAGDATDEIDRWQAVFTGADLPECEVEVDCTAPYGTFSISAEAPAVARLAIRRDDPFGDITPPLPGADDRRVRPLIRFCQSVFNGVGEETVHLAAIELWQAVEAANTRNALRPHPPNQC